MSDTHPYGLLLLGAPAWRSDGGIQPWPPERRLMMLAWLAHHGDWVGRDRLATLLWPGLERGAARRNLRKQIFRARELPGLPPVEERGHMLRWAVPTDVQRFEAAVRGGDDTAAQACWRGPPWQGFDADWADGEGGLAQWLVAERARLVGQWRAALLRLARAHPDGARAGELARCLLQHDALDEEALQLLMRQHLRDGERAQAAAAYARFARGLQDALQLEPGTQSLALWREATAGPFAPGVAACTESDFVGRAAERQALDALLARAGCRWVTLVGAGGSGKTRLARAHFAGAATAAVRRLWVDLEDLSDTAAALQRVACACGATVTGGCDVPALIASALARGRTLLVLDNLEQLPDAARALAQVVSACPVAQVVATSRVRLAVAGEHLLALGGLPWPGPEDTDRALAFDAARLFVLQAQRHCTGFNAAAQSPDVARLCAWVEGNPLALLLAAPWTRHLGVAAIVAELERGAADMLGGDAPGTPTRQHSMAASFEHSWRLLTPAERDALARLAVFSSSFTLEAACEVAAAPAPVLAALLDKSLVQRAEDTSAAGESAAATPRFSLHPLVALFARERGGAAARAAARAAHTSHYLRRLAAFPRPVQAADRAAYYRAAACEATNVRLAWADAVQRRALPLLEPAIEAWSRHWHALGQFAQALDGLDQAEPLLGAVPEARARLWATQSWLYGNLGDQRRALALARKALTVLRRGGDPAARLRCRTYVAGALWRTGATGPARRAFLAVLDQARHDGEGLLAANALYELSSIDEVTGQFASALDFSADALALSERLHTHSPDLEVNHARLLRANGRPAEAVHALQALLQRGESRLSDHLASVTHSNLADALLAMGDLPGAAAADARARAFDSEGQSNHWSAILNLSGARLELRLGHVDMARQRLLRAAELAPGLGWPAVEHHLSCDTAAWLLGTGRVAAAHELLAALLGQRVEDAEVHARARQLHGRRRANRRITPEALRALTQAALHAPDKRRGTPQLTSP
jgi:predicted ATPase/DNA-binding SARP family transcriptional activator